MHSPFLQTSPADRVTSALTPVKGVGALVSLAFSEASISKISGSAIEHARQRVALSVPSTVMIASASPNARILSGLGLQRFVILKATTRRML
jgi:hypothetical protein